MTICQQFVGRLRDLCEGVGRDGRAHPTKEATDSFRLQHGLKPLSDDPEVRSQQLNEEGVVQIETAAVANPAWNLVASDGPGRELEAIFEQLEISYREACGCAAYARQMDEWGVDGCQERFDEIVDRLRNNAEKYSLWEHFRAAGHALKAGLAFQLNPINPFPGIVREAIRRAESKEQSLDVFPGGLNLETSHQ